MADWYPGAWKVNVGGNGKVITQRPAENIFHIAASSWNVDVNDPANPTKGIAGWVSSERSCNSYNDQFGNMQQYCSVFSAVNGTKDGNWRCRTHESWNPEGLNGSEAQYNSSTWTPEQCERFSDFLAWDHIENGALLQDMGSSLRSAHGCGGHRYGIDPWRVSGGELWTAHSGKTCPGTARMRQLPGIVERAKVISAAIRNGKCAYLPPGRVNLSSALARTGNEPPAPPTPVEDDEDMAYKVVQCNGIDYCYGTGGQFFAVRDPDHYYFLKYCGLITVDHGAAPSVDQNVIDFLSNEAEAYRNEIARKVWEYGINSLVNNQSYPASSMIGFIDSHVYKIETGTTAPKA